MYDLKVSINDNPKVLSLVTKDIQHIMSAILRPDPRGLVVDSELSIERSMVFYKILKVIKDHLEDENYTSPEENEE